MAQNVTIAGNQYPDVPSILVPKTGGGGNAVFADPSVVTAVAADVASGKYFLNSSGVLTQGTASGGGGASNVVTGTFKGTTADTAIDLSLGYTGNGYPIAFVIYPEEGPYNSSSGSFYSLVQRYAMAIYCGVKCNQNTDPAYSAQAGVDYYSTLLKYKSSASNATSYSQAGSTEGGTYQDIAASSGTSSCVKIRSKTKMSVFIKASSSGYGFAANITYKYVVLYSQ